MFCSLIASAGASTEETGNVALSLFCVASDSDRRSEGPCRLRVEGFMSRHKFFFLHKLVKS